MIWHSLTPQQLEGCRLEATGIRPSEIAKTLGVTPSTVSNWRKVPEYAEFSRALQMAATQQALDDARVLRVRMLSMGIELAEAGMQRIREGACESCGESTGHAADAREVATLLGSVHAWYKTLSGQTGVIETTGAEVTLGGPRPEEAADALEKLVAKAKRRDPG